MIVPTQNDMVAAEIGCPSRPAASALIGACKAIMQPATSATSVNRRPGTHMGIPPCCIAVPQASAAIFAETILSGSDGGSPRLI